MVGTITTACKIGKFIARGEKLGGAPERFARQRDITILVDTLKSLDMIIQPTKMCFLILILFFAQF